MVDRSKIWSPPLTACLLTLRWPENSELLEQKNPTQGNNVLYRVWRSMNSHVKSEKDENSNQEIYIHIVHERVSRKVDHP